MNKKYLFITLEIKFSNSWLLWQTLVKSEWYLLKDFRIELFIFQMDTPHVLIKAITGLTAVENDSGLLLPLAILNDSAPIAE